MEKNLIYIIALMLIACKSENSASVKLEQQETEVIRDNIQKVEEIKEIEFPHNPFESVAQLKTMDCKEYNYMSEQQRADSLQTYMLRSINSDNSNESGISFFCSFPNSFEEMQKLFGFSNGTAAPLYSSTGKYIQKNRIYSDEIGFFTDLSNLIPHEIYYEKYIKMNINGRWDADNISEAFMIHNEIIDNTQLIAPVMMSFKDEEIESVFRFIFDGPHPKNEYNEKKFQAMTIKLKDDYNRLNILMKEAYDELISEDHSH